MQVKTLILSLIFCAVSQAQIKLRSGITVSGISSGAAMAAQFHMAHSRLVKGAGILAAPPYYCSMGLAARALNVCMKDSWGTPNTDTLADMSRFFAGMGWIDPLGNLEEDRIYIFSGQVDTVVLPKIAKANAEFYESFVSRENIFFEGGINAGHAFPTLSYGNECSAQEQEPFISSCGRDIAGELLSFLLGELNARSDDAVRKGFYELPQPSAPSMDSSAIVFIPENCQKEECELHIHFHGCKQGRSELGNEYFLNIGLNEWARTNKLIVLYPQVRATGLNPNGCWDWWGYSGPNFALKSGAQIRAVKAVVDALYDGSPGPKELAL